MEKSIETKRDKYIEWIFVVLLAFSFAAYVWAGICTPFEGDDFFYSTNLVTGAPLASFADIVQGQIWHYFNWGGRIVGHTILQSSIFIIGEFALNFVNALIAFALIVLLKKCADTKGIGMTFVSFSLIFGAIISFRSALLWQAGVANYPYVSVIVFFFLYWYFRALRGEKDLPVMWLWMPVLGLLAGWSNENLGPTVFILTVIVAVMYCKDGNKISLWMILGSVTSLVGSVVMIAAPGNYVRSSFSAEENIGIVWKMFMRCYNECAGLFTALIYLLIAAAFIFVIGRFVLDIKIGRERVLFLVGALVSWGALIASAVYADRAIWSPSLFLILFILSYMKDIIDKQKNLYLPLMGVTGVFWLRAMYLLLEAVAKYHGWIIS